MYEEMLRKKEVNEMQKQESIYNRKTSLPREYSDMCIAGWDRRKKKKRYRKEKVDQNSKKKKVRTCANTKNIIELRGLSFF